MSNVFANVAVAVAKKAGSAAVKSQLFYGKHRRTIWTALAIVGVTATVVEVARTAPKVKQEIEEMKAEEAPAVDIVKRAGKLSVCALACYGVSIFSIIEAYKAGSDEIASMGAELATTTAALAASNTDLNAFREEFKKEMGEEKAKEVEQSVDQREVIFDPGEIQETGRGTQLFRDATFGTMFRGNTTWLKTCINKLTDMYNNNSGESVTACDWYQILGLQSRGRVLEMFAMNPALDSYPIEIRMDEAETYVNRITGEIESCIIIRMRWELTTEYENMTSANGYYRWANYR